MRKRERDRESGPSSCRLGRRRLRRRHFDRARAIKKETPFFLSFHLSRFSLSMSASQRHRDACRGGERGRDWQAEASFFRVEKKVFGSTATATATKFRRRRETLNLHPSFPDSPLAARGATLALDADVTRVLDRHDVEERAACILVLQERARGERERLFTLFFGGRERGVRGEGGRVSFFPHFGPSCDPATPRPCACEAPARQSHAKARLKTFIPEHYSCKLVSLSSSLSPSLNLGALQTFLSFRVFYINSENQKMHDKIFSGCFSFGKAAER